MGVNIVRYKVVAFALAGFLAGVAGGLLAANVGQLDGRVPGERLDHDVRADRDRRRFPLVGPDLGRSVVARVPGAAHRLGIDGNIAIMVFGAGLLHALITAPQGVSGQVVGLGRLIGPKAAASSA